MSMSTEVVIYNKKEIEDYIEKYPNTKVCFENCGMFLGEHYIIMENDFVGDYSPIIQLSYWIKEIEARNNGIEFEFEEDLDEFNSIMEREFWDLSRDDYCKGSIDRFEVMRYGKI